ncbi:MAG TPA: MipA/OmpV family protein [Candidatus Binatia bacterium]|jgi:outer membrane scaffolding protein for murein synthesis (MipA/OmpV family)
MTAAFVALSLMATTMPVAAEERPKWELGVGGVFYGQPDYTGSDQYRFHALPFPWIVYRGPRLRLDRESIQTKIFAADFVHLDLSAGGQVPVNSSRNDRRRGMPDLDWIAELGPTLIFPVRQSGDGRHTLQVDVPVRIALAIDTDNFSYEGFVASPKLVYRYEPEAWRLEANAGLEFASDDYDQYVYGVAPRFATTTRRAYGADGGYAGVRLAAGVSRYFGPFYAGLFVRYVNLDGASFENSPLVATRSAVVGGIAIGWVWLKSSEMVPVGAEANVAARKARAPAAPPEGSRAPAAPPEGSRASATPSEDSAAPPEHSHAPAASPAPAKIDSAARPAG